MYIFIVTLNQFRAKAEELSAEKDAWIATARAKGRENVAKYEADAFKVIAEAKGKVAPMIRDRREHELAIEKTNILLNLAHNSKVAVSGLTDNSLLAEILTNNNQTNVLLGLKKHDNVM